MTTALLIGAVLAALACPLHVLWRTRQGGRGGCPPPGRDQELEALDRRRQALADDPARTARG